METGYNFIQPLLTQLPYVVVLIWLILELEKRARSYINLLVAEIKLFTTRIDNLSQKIDKLSTLTLLVAVNDDDMKKKIEDYLDNC